MTVDELAGRAARSAGEDVAARARADAGGIRSALPYPDRHVARLGAGALGARPARQGLSQSHCRRPRRDLARVGERAALTNTRSYSTNANSASSRGPRTPGSRRASRQSEGSIAGKRASPAGARSTSVISRRGRAQNRLGVDFAPARDDDLARSAARAQLSEPQRLVDIVRDRRRPAAQSWDRA